jgi:hypothetical protein
LILEDIHPRDVSSFPRVKEAESSVQSALALSTTEVIETSTPRSSLSEQKNKYLSQVIQVRNASQEQKIENAVFMQNV